MKTKIVLFSLVLLGSLVSCTTKPAGADEKKECCKKDTTACCEQPATCKDSAQKTKIIAAKIFIKPEKVAEFTTLFKEMTEKTLAEPGCTGYQLYQNPYEKGTFMVFETYKNQAAIDAHFAAPYFKELGEKMASLTSKAAEISIYDVAGEVKK